MADERRPIEQSLLLFYVFERAISGILGWAAKHPPQGDTKMANAFDPRLAKYLVDDCRPGTEYAVSLIEPRDGIDLRYMSSGLREYLNMRLNGKEPPPFLGMENRKLAGILRDDLTRLGLARNRVMHGGVAPEDQGETSRRLAKVFVTLRDSIARHLEAQGPLKGEDRKWFALLCLSETELGWFANGGSLPRGIESPLSLQRKAIGYASALLAAGDYRPACVSEVCGDAKRVWISAEPFPAAAAFDAHVYQMRDQIDDRELALVPTRLVRFDDDVVGAPAWERLPEGVYHLCAWEAG